VGQEVIVDFLEGDPDQPVIVGSLYNAKQMPPYLGNGLDLKHRNDPKVSGIKSCSTPGGEGFNEIRFDDTRGKEQLFLHAQRAMDIQVKGRQMTSVGGDKNVEVGGNYLEHVVGDRSNLVEGDSFQLALGNGGVGSDGPFRVQTKSHLYIKGNS